MLDDRCQRTDFLKGSRCLARGGHYIGLAVPAQDRKRSVLSDLVFEFLDQAADLFGFAARPE